MRDLLAQFGVAGVHHDSVEPRLDARNRRQGVPEPPGPQEGFLDRFFGIGRIAEDEARRAKGHRVPVLEPVFQPLFHHPPL